MPFVNVVPGLTNDLLIEKKIIYRFTVSVLHIFKIYYFIQAVELLLTSREVRSALANGEVRKTDPPLHLASKTGHVEIVR